MLFDLHPHELIVDSFAGGGGASTGIYRATGRHPDIAINHDPEAIAMHQANHPHTRHMVEDVWHADPRKVTGGKPVGLLWASPDCKHHSKAKGGKPREKKIRSLAWVVVWWAAKVRPRVIMLENVEEFGHWGPLDKDGNPIKDRKGETFRQWVKRLEFYGYSVEWRELRASEFGAPTTRKRLFVIARCDGIPIRWPTPTHGPGRKPVRTAAEIIDWSIPCPSIFDRKRPLVEATLRRIAKGIMKYVVNNPQPFIITANHTAAYYQYFRGQRLDEPLQTITTSPGFALVTPYLSTYYGAKSPEGDARGRAANKPLPTQGTENRFALVAAFLAKHFGTDPAKMPAGVSPEQPLDTITASDHHALVTAFISRQFSNRIGHKADEPLRTTLIECGDRSALVSAFLVKYYGAGVGQHISTPLDTVTTKDRFGLVTVMIAGEPYVITDIGMRMLTPRELFCAQGFDPDYIIDPVYKGKPLSKKAQTRMVGNSVGPQLAQAIVQANLLHGMAVASD